MKPVTESRILWQPLACIRGANLYKSQLMVVISHIELLLEENFCLRKSVQKFPDSNFQSQRHWPTSQSSLGPPSRSSLRAKRTDSNFSLSMCENLTMSRWSAAIGIDCSLMIPRTAESLSTTYFSIKTEATISFRNGSLTGDKRTGPFRGDIASVS